jgi:hypothetical protein
VFQPVFVFGAGAEWREVVQAQLLRGLFQGSRIPGDVPGKLSLDLLQSRGIGQVGPLFGILVMMDVREGLQPGLAQKALVKFTD